MDDLFGNIQFEHIDPSKEEQIAKKSRKRSKLSEKIDEEDVVESSEPAVKKVKRHKPELSLQQEQSTILSRKQQYTQFDMFCCEHAYHELDGISLQQYIGLSYKNFAKCKIDDISDGQTVLSQFLTGFLADNWNQEKSTLTQKGAPLLLIISSSAVRSLEMAREAKLALGNDCVVAKLFAKHMKLDKQQEFMLTHVSHIATGTPERLLQLIQKFNFLSTSLKLVILDWERKDAKQRTLIEISENKKPLAILLRDYLIPFVLSCQTKLFLL